MDVQLQPVTTAPVSGTVVTLDGPAVNYAAHLIPNFGVHMPWDAISRRRSRAPIRAANSSFPLSPLGRTGPDLEKSVEEQQPHQRAAR